MTRYIIANNLPYTEPQTDPLEALRDVLAFSSRDWAMERDTAWLYGIVFGWGPDEDDPEEDPAGSYPSLAEKFGWTAEAVERLKRLHDAFEQLGPSA